MSKNYWNNVLVFISIFLFLISLSALGYSKQKTINKKIELENNNIQGLNDCKYTYIDGYFEINANCILKKQLPELTLVAIVNTIWDQISDLSGYYEPFEKSFDYYGAKPNFTTQGSPYLQGNEESINLINQAIENKQKIRISYNELAQYYATHLSYFVADKDISNLGNCSKTNYLLALNSINNYIINPENSLNINQELIKINNYCKGNSLEDYAFYGGVCGLVSQLFRVSLLNPDINISKRYNHNEWFVQYYGEDIGGDDAAVYEKSKQFEIKNIGDSDIILKAFQEDNKTLLVAISRPVDKRVSISKENINGNNRSIHLEKKIYNKADELINTEGFDSYYTKKTYEFR